MTNEDDSFGNIGNRKWGDMRNGSSSRKADYTANLLNQYEQRTVPGALDVLGAAHSNSTITVNGQTATRQDAYYHREIAVTNDAAAIWQPIEVVGTLTNPPVAITNSGHLFLAKTPEPFAYAFAYDLDGNQTSDGRWTNTWDAENRLISMETRADLLGDVPRLRLEFQYDFQGRRVRKQVFSLSGSSWVQVLDVRFVYDGWNLLAEVNSSGTAIRSYVWGLDLSGSMQAAGPDPSGVGSAGGVGGLLAVNAGTNGTHFAASDGNGNVVGLFKSNDAAVTAIFEYGPFGNTLRATGPMAGDMLFRFSTKYTDIEAGRVYYGIRDYDPDTGRWLSRDPIEEQGCRHLYAFCRNDSINYFDLLGYKVEFEKSDTVTKAEYKSVKGDYDRAKNRRDCKGKLTTGAQHLRDLEKSKDKIVLITVTTASSTALANGSHGYIQIQPKRSTLNDGAKFNIESAFAHEGEHVWNDFNNRGLSRQDSEIKSRIVENEHRCAMGIDRSDGLRNISP